MGYSASSYAVFGKKTTRKALTIKRQGRGCTHNIDETQKFCPKCGKPVFMTEEIFIADEELDEKVQFFAPTYESNDGILGFKLNDTSDEEIDVISKPNPQMTEDILEFYKSHGIPCNESELKIYIFTYHSY